MKTVATLLLALATTSAFAAETNCDSKALAYAKAIREIADPIETANSTFKITDKQGDEISQVYSVEMVTHASGGDYTVHQQLVVEEGTCSLYSYSLPGAG